MSQDDTWKTHTNSRGQRRKRNPSYTVLQQEKEDEKKLKAKKYRRRVARRRNKIERRNHIYSEKFVEDINDFISGDGTYCDDCYRKGGDSSKCKFCINDTLKMQQIRAFLKNHSFDEYIAKARRDAIRKLGKMI